MSKEEILILIFTGAIIVALLLGGVLGHYAGYQKGIIADKELPECDFSMTFQLQGQHHSGYWVEQDALNKNVCAIRFNEPITVMDGGK